MNLTRKEFLVTGTKYAAGAVVGAGAVSMLSQSIGRAGTQATWPYPYQALDVEKVRKYGHDLYYVSGCSYGSFHALVKALSELIPDPWATFPSQMMIYGKGGGEGWGGLCGGINGPSAFIALVCPTSARADVLIGELFGWYTQTKFPSDISNQYGVNSEFGDNRFTQALAQNTSGSILCHVSVTEWCKAAAKVQTSADRKERCARLTGDVAAYAAKILNDEFAGTFAATYVPPAAIATCNSCHTLGDMNIVAAKMNCVQCHGDHTVSGVSELGGQLPSDYKLEQNYPNPFNPQTRLSFSIPKATAVDLCIYDVHGQVVRNLIPHQDYAPGNYAVQWDGTNNAGGKVASGVYFCRLQAGSFSATKKMAMVK